MSEGVMGADTRGTGGTDSPRCDICGKPGDHHTDRHPRPVRGTGARRWTIWVCPEHGWQVPAGYVCHHHPRGSRPASVPVEVVEVAEVSSAGEASRVLANLALDYIAAEDEVRRGGAGAEDRACAVANDLSAACDRILRRAGEAQVSDCETCGGTREKPNQVVAYGEPHGLLVQCGSSFHACSSGSGQEDA